MNENTATYEAWHSSHDFFCDFSRNNRSEIILGETHFKVHAIECDAQTLHLDEAFDYFNWLHADFAAPPEVNSICREKGTHASMTAGDIVVVRGATGRVTVFLCDRVGWKQLCAFNKEVFSA